MAALAALAEPSDADLLLGHITDADDAVAARAVLGLARLGGELPAAAIEAVAAQADRPAAAMNAKALLAARSGGPPILGRAVVSFRALTRAEDPVSGVPVSLVLPGGAVIVVHTDLRGVARYASSPTGPVRARFHILGMEAD